jgi:FkbM family methyltransferase
LQANTCKNVKVIEGAVYNMVGKEVVFPEPDFVRFSSYGSYGIDPNAQTGRKIRTITIDSLNIQEPICFMKIDIQGSDIFALQGAKETILKNKMPIVFEFEQQFQDEFKTTFNDYVDFVHSINYKFVKIIDSINYVIAPV